MILITGGRGAVAKNLIGLLNRAGEPTRAASASPDQLHMPDGVPVVKLDLADPSTFATALAGVSSVFLYASPEHITEFVEEAVEAGVSHIVLLSSASVLGPDPESDPLAATHLTVERALLASPITTTILRPGSFAGNAGSWAWSIKSGAPVSLPYPNSYNDPIHELDVAEAALVALTNSQHRGGQFTLSGPETMTFIEQIRRLGQATNQDIQITPVSREQWKQEVAEYLPASYADALLNFWASNDSKPTPLTSTVEDLTGHPARDFTLWASEHASDFIG